MLWQPRHGSAGLLFCDQQTRFRAKATATETSCPLVRPAYFPLHTRQHQTIATTNQTRQAVHAENNIVTRSRKHRCNGKATIHYVSHSENTVFHKNVFINQSIISHYNPLWIFAFSVRSLQVLLSLAVSFQFLIFSFFRSSMTSSCHRCLGLPIGLVPIGFQSNSFLVGLAWSILWICPSHLILCALMNLTISAPFINLSISMSLRIVHILSILIAPNIFLSICPSKMRRLFSSFAVKDKNAFMANVSRRQQ